MQSVALAYALPAGELEFRNVVDTWIDVKRAQGAFESAKAYRVHGEGLVQRSPRWSIARNGPGVAALGASPFPRSLTIHAASPSDRPVWPAAPGRSSATNAIAGDETRHGGERRGIGRLDVEQLRLQQAGQPERRDQAARPGRRSSGACPCPSTIPSTLPRVAPSAMWMPISLVRSVTEYDRMP